jgi:sugar phosphate isomerase/epimerase
MKLTRQTRREMMKSSARLSLAGLSLGAGFLSSSSLWSKPSPHSGQRFKIGACDWTLEKRTNPAALEVAKRLGLDGIMVDMGDPQNGFPLLKPELQKNYLTTSKRLQVEIASLALGLLNQFPYKTDPRAQQWVADSLEVSRAFGTHVVLVAFFDKGDLKNDKNGIEVVIQRFKEIAPQAEKAGVVLGIESWLSAEEHMAIVDKVGSSAVQVYYDMGNSHKMGYDIYKEIRFLGKHICEFHAKDYDDLYGKGTINFPEVRRAMDDIGYSGWMQIEGTKTPLGVEESIGYDARYLRTVFPKNA